VLGGGIVPGSFFRRRTRNGKPLLQISLKLPYKTLYVSGEESQKQIK
jgi:DNA repair protein RadA/Sms